MEAIKNTLKVVGRSIIKHEKIIYTVCITSALFLMYAALTDIKHEADLLKKDVQIQHLETKSDYLESIASSQHTLLTKQSNIINNQENQLKQAEVFIKKIIEELNKYKRLFEADKFTT